MKTYLFYDTETTGLSHVFDQIIQFAAIRTDLSLKEISRHEIRIRLRPDVIPSPGALLTHGVSIFDLMAGVCEYEAIQQIHRLVNEPGTISVGYNSLSFDDKVLRFSFHRNLLTPYTHQYANDCGRMDLFPVTVLYWLFHHQALEWPLINGKPSFKLEHLNQANRLATGKAHDALADVEALVALVSHFMHDMDVWRAYTHHFDRQWEKEWTNSLPKSLFPIGARHKAIAIRGRHGVNQNFQVPVCYLGRSEPYNNQTLWLRLDTPDLRQVEPEALIAQSQVIRKKSGDDTILWPAGGGNSQIDPQRLAIARENSEWLQTHKELGEALARYHCCYRYPEIPDLDADVSLYQDGFISEEEAARCHLFHLASIATKRDLIAQFSHKNRRELARRILGRNYQLGYYLDEYGDYVRRVRCANGDSPIVDYRGENRLTAARARAEIEQLKAEATGDSGRERLLVDLQLYIESHFGSMKDEWG